MSLFHGWRVEDASSRAQWTPNGILSGSDDLVEFQANTRQEKETLREAMLAHLDWGNRVDTPFISVYKSNYRAVKEANRRLDAGKANVVIHEIVIDESCRGRVQFRYVPKLMCAFDEGFTGAKYEFVFLHRIPPECVRTIRN